MDAAAAPTAAEMAAAAPPPGVGCLAARAVRNWSIGRDFVGAMDIVEVMHGTIHCRSIKLTYLTTLGGVLS